MVVCPASVKYNWEAEAKRTIGVRAYVAEGRKPPDMGKLRQPPRLTIINYDILQYWLKYLLHTMPMTVVFDECQYLKNKANQRTRAATALARACQNALGLSGTALVNRPSELWPILNIIRPDLYKSFWSFGTRYCAPKLGPWGWEYKGATRLGELHTQLRENLMVRRLKRDVLHQLPEKMRRVVVVPMANLAEYKHANTDFLGWLKQHRPGRVVTARRAEQLAKLQYLMMLVGRHKLRGVVDWANHFLEESGEKLILFAIHRKMIEALDRRVQGGHVVVHGGIGAKARHAAVERFEQDPECKVLIGNLQAAGVGINATAASTVAFAELWWRPGDFTQGEDRAHRIGQSKVTWCYYLVARDTIEVRLAELIQTKQAVLSKVLDGGELDTDINIFDQLIKDLENGHTGVSSTA